MLTTTTVRTRSGSRYVLTTVDDTRFVTRLSEIPLRTWGGQALPDEIVHGRQVEWMSSIEVGRSWVVVFADGDRVTTTPVESIDSESVTV